MGTYFVSSVLQCPISEDFSTFYICMPHKDIDFYVSIYHVSSVLKIQLSLGLMVQQYVFEFHALF